MCGKKIFSGLIRPGCKTARSPARDLMDASVGERLLWRPGGPRENSGTTVPATVPVVPLFPKSSESEVIIRKNAEQDPEFAEVCRREYMRSYLATFGWQKSGQDDVYEVGGFGRRPDLSFWHTLLSWHLYRCCSVPSVPAIDDGLHSGSGSGSVNYKETGSTSHAAGHRMRGFRVPE